MSNVPDGNSPGGAPPPPTNPPGHPPGTPRPNFAFTELPSLNRRRVREILGPALRAELAEYLAERAAQHVPAA